MREKRILLGLLLLLGGCATAAPPEDFTVPPKEFFARVRVIAQAPMFSARGMSREKAQALSQMFERLMAERLTRQGFTLIPAAETLAISARLVRDLGGLFDPNTGREDEEKVRVYLEYLRRELKERFRADAVLTANLVQIKAPYSGVTARWHGTSQAIASGGAALAGLLFGPASGTVQALSLSAWIDDAASGRRLWVGFGGIHLLSKREGDKWVNIPLEEALGDSERNREAVVIAFQSLVAASDASSSPR